MRKSQQHSKSVPAAAAGSAAPQSVRVGAWIGLAQSLLGMVYAIALIYRDIKDIEDDAAISGAGTALWFILMFGAIAAGAIFLLRGYRWGRGPIILFNLCLLGVAYYMFRSDAFHLAWPTLAVALIALICMFNGRALEWAANEYGR